MNTKKNETHAQIFALVAALILAAVLASGCSTPAVTGGMNDDSKPAVSYTNCIQVMTQYGAQYQCNAIGATTGTASSYNTYTGATTVPTTTVPTYTYPTYIYTYDAKRPAVATEKQLQDAYVDYLKTIDADSAAEMSAQWDAIVQAKLAEVGH